MVHQTPAMRVFFYVRRKRENYYSDAQAKRRFAEGSRLRDTAKPLTARQKRLKSVDFDRFFMFLCRFRG